MESKGPTSGENYEPTSPNTEKPDIFSGSFDEYAFNADGELTENEKQKTLLHLKFAEKKGEIHEQFKNFVISDYGQTNINELKKAHIDISKINTLFGISENTFNMQTFYRIIDFQKDNNLTPTGIISGETLQKIVTIANKIQKSVSYIEKSKKISPQELQTLFRVDSVLSLDFHTKLKTYQESQGLEPDGIYGEKSESKIQNDALAGMIATPETKKLCENLLDNSISTVIGELAKKGSIELSSGGILTKVIQVLKSATSSQESIYSKQEIGYVIGNFLSPREKGEKYIADIVALTLPPKNFSKEKRKKTELRFALSSLYNALGTMIDIGQNSSKQKLQSFIQEFQNLPSVSHILAEFPEVKSIIINILPQIMAQIDKQEFLGEFKKIIHTIEGVYGKESPTKEDKLGVFNGVFSMIKNIIPTENPVENTGTDVMSQMLQLPLVQKNPLARDIIKILNNSNVSYTQKRELAEGMLDFLILSTDKVVDVDLINKNIDSLFAKLQGVLDTIKDPRLKKATVGHVFSLIKTVSGKDLGQEKLGDFVVHTGVESLKNSKSSETSNMSFGDIVDLMKSNKDILRRVLQNVLHMDDTNLEDFGVELIFDMKILKNFTQRTNHSIVESVRKFLGVKIDIEILSYRKALVEKYDFSFPEYSQKLSPLKKKILGSTSKIFGEKIQSGGKITLGEVTDMARGIVKGMVPNIMKTVKQSGVPLSGKFSETFAQDVINDVIGSKDFDNIVKLVLKNVASQTKNTSDVISQLEPIIKKSVKKYTQGKEFESMVFNRFIKQVVQYKEKGKLSATTLNNLLKSYKVPVENISIDGQNIGEVLHVFIQYLDNKTLTSLLRKGFTKMRGLQGKKLSKQQAMNVFGPLGIEALSRLQVGKIPNEKVSQKQKTQLRFLQKALKYYGDFAIEDVPKLQKAFSAKKLSMNQIRSIHGPVSRVFTVFQAIAKNHPGDIPKLLSTIEKGGGNKDIAILKSVFKKNQLFYMIKLYFQNKGDTSTIVESYFKNPNNADVFVRSIQEALIKKHNIPTKRSRSQNIIARRERQQETFH